MGNCAGSNGSSESPETPRRKSRRRRRREGGKPSRKNDLDEKPKEDVQEEGDEKRKSSSRSGSGRREDDSRRRRRSRAPSRRDKRGPIKPAYLEDDQRDEKRRSRRTSRREITKRDDEDQKKAKTRLVDEIEVACSYEDLPAKQGRDLPAKQGRDLPVKQEREDLTAKQERDKQSVSFERNVVQETNITQESGSVGKKPRPQLSPSTDSTRMLSNVKLLQDLDWMAKQGQQYNSSFDWNSPYVQSILNRVAVEVEMNNTTQDLSPRQTPVLLRCCVDKCPDCELIVQRVLMASRNYPKFPFLLVEAVFETKSGSCQVTYSVIMNGQRVWTQEGLDAIDKAVAADYFNDKVLSLTS